MKFESKTLSSLTDLDANQLLKLTPWKTLPESVYDLVYERQKIKACIIYQQVFDEAEILYVYTHPDNRRQGYSTTLLNNIINKPGLSKLFLEVRKGNHSARKLYLKLGFIEKGKRKNYYNHPREDAIIMQYQRGANE